uniref:Kazal-like domain-containing protein n=1 Tax=Pelusios castaneus TaxID=367368 RepID=A0A8C8RY79_9SAUR
PSRVTLLLFILDPLPSFLTGEVYSTFQVDCKEFMDNNMYCTRESNPHCASNGVTYGNKCSFCKAAK